EIRLSSVPGRGSTFSLYLPETYVPPHSIRKPAAGTPEMTNIPQNTLVSEVLRDAPNFKFVAPTPAGTEMGNGTSGHTLAAIVEPSVASLANEASDDRHLIQPGDRVLLIVENDLSFARLLLDSARSKGFKGLVTSLGAGALSLTREYMPSAITLATYLADIGGWRVLGRFEHVVYMEDMSV